MYYLPIIMETLDLQCFLTPLQLTYMYKLKSLPSNLTRLDVLIAYNMKRL